jgi:sensor domain CHASE-containing protein
LFRFFRSLRQKLLAENRVGRYLAYALGEILLVVIGILIALQVNTWNEDRVQRSREVKYLKNIRLDLEKDLASLDYQIANRTGIPERYGSLQPDHGGPAGTLWGD